MIVSFKDLKFIIAGLIFLILIWLYLGFDMVTPVIEEYTFYNASEQVYGVVNNIEKYQKISGRSYVTRYNFYVSYETLDGKKYDNIKAKYNNLNEGSYKKGDTILVAYDKNNPTKIGVNTYSLSVMDIVIFIMYIAAIAYIIFQLTKSCIDFKKAKSLIKNGIRGVAEITNIVPKGTGRYRVYTIYYVFSHPYSANNNHSVAMGKTKASSAKRLYAHQRLDVYFDPENPNVYCLNIDPPK